MLSKRLRNAACWVLCSQVVVGCYSTTYYTKRTSSGQRHSEWNHRFVYGAIDPGEPVNVDAHCAHGMASAKTQVTAANGILGFMAQMLTTLVVAGPWYVAEHDRGETFQEWSKAQPASNFIAPRIWSPSTITVMCAEREAF
jgi:hypothetical protein